MVFPALYHGFAKIHLPPFEQVIGETCYSSSDHKCGSVLVK